MEKQIYSEIVELNGYRFNISMFNEDPTDPMTQPTWNVDLLGYPELDIIEDFASLNEAMQYMSTFALEENINWNKYGYAWVPIEEKESLVKELSVKMQWSYDQCLNSLSDADGYSLIPVYGMDWWINFIKRTA